jgi:hypothetical protein
LGTHRIKQDEYRARCAALADFLARSPRVRDHFNINEMARGGGDDVDRRGSYCGTAACVAGWAPSVPSFRPKGLRYTTERGGSIIDFVYEHGKKKVFGLDAVQRFLGLSEGVANWLFMPYRYYCGAGNYSRAAQDTVRRAAIARLRALAAGTIKLRQREYHQTLDGLYGVD